MNNLSCESFAFSWDFDVYMGLTAHYFRLIRTKNALKVFMKCFEHCRHYIEWVPNWAELQTSFSSFDKRPKTTHLSACNHPSSSSITFSPIVFPLTTALNANSQTSATDHFESSPNICILISFSAPFFLPSFFPTGLQLHYGCQNQLKHFRLECIHHFVILESMLTVVKSQK